MGRGTTSDIVYFEQLGRALAVRGNTKDMYEELEKYSIDELIKMCRVRDIPINENTPKEELIEKLIAPVVIDLTNNYEFIKDLENNLRDRIKDIRSKGLGSHRKIKISNATFDIEIANQDLYEMLKYVRDKLTITWENYYELAKVYYNHYGNLVIPISFKTQNGYDFDPDGVALGAWIGNQRKTYQGTGKGKLTETQINLLNEIGMIWNTKKNRKEIKEICLENNIDMKKNKLVLNHISIQVLESLIAFLKVSNLDIVNEDGLLIDIFSMSSVDMQEKYGVSLAELINEYYVKNKKDKGV